MGQSLLNFSPLSVYKPTYKYPIDRKSIYDVHVILYRRAVLLFHCLIMYEKCKVSYLWMKIRSSKVTPHRKRPTIDIIKMFYCFYFTFNLGSLTHLLHEINWHCEVFSSYRVETQKLVGVLNFLESLLFHFNILLKIFIISQFSTF